MTPATGSASSVGTRAALPAPAKCTLVHFGIKIYTTDPFLKASTHCSPDSNVQ